MLFSVKVHITLSNNKCFKCFIPRSGHIVFFVEPIFHDIGLFDPDRETYFSLIIRQVLVIARETLACDIVQNASRPIRRWKKPHPKKIVVSSTSNATGILLGLSLSSLHYLYILAIKVPPTYERSDMSNGSNVAHNNVL